jgi:membrane-bound lytic murein transglycosylase B
VGRVLPALGVGLAAVALVVTALLAGRPPQGPSAGVEMVAAAAPVDVAPDDVTGAPGAAVSPDPAWVGATAARTGIAARALQAYAVATLRSAHEHPGCHLGWTTLAGIGHVESGHGGAGLDADGRAVVHGPVLDGTSGYAAIEEDGAWDRARGPMQFIASTWRRWGSDADGDGAAVVDDVDDAAWSTARYLCASGADLRTPAGWTRAVHSYNHSDAYVRSVLAAADAYASRAGP